MYEGKNVKKNMKIYEKSIDTHLITELPYGKSIFLPLNFIFGKYT